MGCWGLFGFASLCCALPPLHQRARRPRSAAPRSPASRRGSPHPAHAGNGLSTRRSRSRGPESREAPGQPAQLRKWPRPSLLRRAPSRPERAAGPHVAPSSARLGRHSAFYQTCPPPQARAHSPRPRGSDRGRRRGCGQRARQVAQSLRVSSGDLPCAGFPSGRRTRGRGAGAGALLRAPTPTRGAPGPRGPSSRLVPSPPHGCPSDPPPACSLAPPHGCPTDPPPACSPAPPPQVPQRPSWSPAPPTGAGGGSLCQGLW